MQNLLFDMDFNQGGQKGEVVSREVDHLGFQE